MVIRVVFKDGLRLYFGTTSMLCISDMTRYVNDSRVVSVTLSRTFIKESYNQDDDV